MNLKKVLSGAFIAFALLTLPIAIFALPRGTYTSSCRSCHMHNNILFCICRQPSGVMQARHFNRPYRCNHIRNLNGFLRCATTQPGPTYSFPPGNYRSFCTQCRMMGQGGLTCYCRHARGTRRAYLANAYRCRYVTSVRGYLRCRTAGPRPLALPPGRYRTNCHTCSYNGYTLRCTCQTAVGGWRRSALSRANRCRNIINRNGYLRCATTAGVLPPGSYTASCHACTYRGSVLRCRCRMYDGRYRTTALGGAGRCRNVVNLNGSLRCVTRTRVPIPRGSYTRSCRGCVSNGRTLRCNFCQRANRTWRRNVYLYNIVGCRDIANLNGQLVCRR